jgi:hypothetical protein
MAAIIAILVLAALGIGYGAGYHVASSKYEAQIVNGDSAFRDALGTVEKNPNYRPR